MESSSAAENLNNLHPAVEMSSRQRWFVVIGVMTGMFVAALEATVVGTAMPTVIASLGGLNHYSWVFSAYIVTSTVTVPVWGKLSDLYGRRLLYQIGIGVFILGSMLSGMATSMTELIIFRAIQGLGAGALIPLGMTIIGDIFTLEERTRMQAFFSGVWGLSSIIGPVIGGFITDQLSWRWVFYINLPIGIVDRADHRLFAKRTEAHPKTDGGLRGRDTFDDRDQPADAGNGRRRRFPCDIFFGGKSFTYCRGRYAAGGLCLGRKESARPDHSF